MSPRKTKQSTNIDLSKYIKEIDGCDNETVKKLCTITDKNQIAKYLYYLDQHKMLANPPQFDLGTSIGAVLRKPDIERFCEQRMPPLIEPLDKNYLRESASYELRLGSRYRLGDSNQAEWLSDSKKDLIIPQHSIAIVSTYEWLNIPGCLIARWNLRVTMVYRGLVWVGSLQVDPGYQGFLFCPIYNLSDQDQLLIYKDPLFIIDFVLTTPAKDKYGLWELRKGKYSTFDFDRLDEYKIDSAPASSFKELRTNMENLKKDTEETIIELERKTERFQDIILVVIGVIIAALAIISTFGITNTEWKQSWVEFVLIVSALVLSLVAVIIASRKRRNN